MNNIVTTREHAKNIGAKRFFTGVECIHGHLSERYVSTGTCCACIKELSAKWALSNIEWIREYGKKYRKNTDVAEKHREQSRKYHWKNREKILEKNREKYKNNFILKKEKIKLQNKYNDILKEEDPIRYYLYRAICNHNRRCVKIGVPGRLSYQSVFNILKQQQYKCFTCDSKLTQNSISLDHWMPIALGGTNDCSNIKFLCNFCNFSKSDKHPEDWVRLNDPPTIPRESNTSNA